ncbi:hypothetical protein [Phyllobacterium sophorae]|uniref:Uncharacterized protein n=1 Tax=Phyllobacterium sophorae TaxID=1520277 RepID=A0A2P7AXQ8_9HYPH|nr:hypothetical protein [Phyllobacterium sophorae]PSH58992.1 hypothetical protein CU103_27365 [Phyllobacterium sophorae]
MYDILLDTPAQLTAMRVVIVLGVELDLLPAQAYECPYGRMRQDDMQVAFRSHFKVILMAIDSTKLERLEQAEIEQTKR